MKQKKQTVTQARKHPATAQPAPILSEIHIDDDQDGDQDDGIRSIARTQCGNPACKKYFVGTEAFDAHRVGDYGGPIDTNGKLVGFKKSERRCLTDAEMRSKGMECEPRMVRFYLDGSPAREQHDVWYKVLDRERARQHFQG